MQGFAHVDCAAEVSIQNRQGSGFRSAAPVSHQKQPHQNATNAIEIEQKRSKINEADRYSAAHNGLVAGSSPAGPTKEISDLSILIFSTPPEIPTGSGTTSAQIAKPSQWSMRSTGRARRPACRSCRRRKVSTHDVCFRSMIGHSLATSAVPCARSRTHAPHQGGAQPLC